MVSSQASATRQYLTTGILWSFAIKFSVLPIFLTNRFRIAIYLIGIIVAGVAVNRTLWCITDCFNSAVTNRKQNDSHWLFGRSSIPVAIACVFAISFPISSVLTADIYSVTIRNLISILTSAVAMDGFLSCLYRRFKLSIKIVDTVVKKI